MAGGGDAGGCLASTMWHAVEFSRFERAPSWISRPATGQPCKFSVPVPPRQTATRAPTRRTGPQSYSVGVHEAPAGSEWESHPRVLAVALFSPSSSASLRAAWDNLRLPEWSRQLPGSRACRDPIRSSDPIRRSGRAVKVYLTTRTRPTVFLPRRSTAHPPLSADDAVNARSGSATPSLLR